MSAVAQLQAKLHTCNPRMSVSCFECATGRDYYGGFLKLRRLSCNVEAHPTKEISSDSECPP